MTEYNPPIVTVTEEIRDTYKFDMPTGIKSSAVFGKTNTYSIGRNILPATIFIAVAYGLGAWFMWSQGFQAVTIILGVVAVLGLILTIWAPIAVAVSEASFLRELRKELKKADVKFFREEDAQKPITERVSNKALKALIVSFSGRETVKVGFIQGDSTKDYGMRYRVRGFDSNGQVSLHFSPVSTNDNTYQPNPYSETKKHNSNTTDVAEFGEFGGAVLMGIAAVFGGN